MLLGGNNALSHKYMTNVDKDKQMHSKNGASMNLLKTLGDDDLKIPASVNKGGKSMKNIDQAKSKSSMVKVGEGQDVYGDNKRFSRAKPISVWDQMVVHDSNLYQKEQEERKRRKRLE